MSYQSVQESKVRVYRFTVATVWYDEEAAHAREIEAHFVTARAGDIQQVRQELAERGLKFLRDLIRRRYRQLPDREIRVGFEAEELALAPTDEVRVDILSMEFTGRGKGRRERARRDETRRLRRRLQTDEE